MINYLPLPSKSCQWLKGGAGRSETLENRRSSTNISKRLWSSEKWKCKQAVERGHINAIHVILWWPEPLGNVSGWVFLFGGLVLLRTTLCAFSGFGKGKIIAQNVHTKIGLIVHIYFGIFCTGWEDCSSAEGHSSVNGPMGKKDWAVCRDQFPWSIKSAPPPYHLILR